MTKKNWQHKWWKAYYILKTFCYVTSFLLEVFWCNLTNKFIKGIKDNLTMATQALSIPSVIKWNLEDWLKFWSKLEGEICNLTFYLFFFFICFGTIKCYLWTALVRPFNSIREPSMSKKSSATVITIALFATIIRISKS